MFAEKAILRGQCFRMLRNEDVVGRFGIMVDELLHKVVEVLKLRNGLMEIVFLFFKIMYCD